MKRRQQEIAAMHPSLSLTLSAVLLAVGTLSWLWTPFGAGASSHREAPLISKDPSVDNTDVYAFVSPDDASKVTLIANWIPFEEPAGGPNFYHLDRKSTRLNSSHSQISYAVFCLKKKKKK